MRFAPDCSSAYSLGQCTVAVMVIVKLMVSLRVMDKRLVLVMIIVSVKLMVWVRVTVMDKLIVWVRARLPTNMHSPALVCWHPFLASLQQCMPVNAILIAPISGYQLTKLVHHSGHHSARFKVEALLFLTLNWYSHHLNR